MRTSPRLEVRSIEASRLVEVVKLVAVLRFVRVAVTSLVVSGAGGAHGLLVNTMCCTSVVTGSAYWLVLVLGVDTVDLGGCLSPGSWQTR